MKQLSIILFFFVAVLISSCGSDNGDVKTEMSFAEIGSSSQSKAMELKPKEFVSWVRDPENGFLRTKQIDEFEFSVQYKPYEYITCLEERKENIEAEIVKNKTEELKGMTYFDLIISAGGNNGELLKYKLPKNSDYPNRIDYYSFNFQKDIFLVQNNDTIPCSMFHFERTFDIAPYAKFLLAFPVTDSKSKEATVLFYDKIFDKGMIKISFDKQALSKVPKLETI